MKHNLYKPFIFLYIGLLIAGCRTTSTISDTRIYSNQKVDSSIKEDVKVSSIILPYKKQLDDEMNKVIAYNPKELNKKGLSSNLGNLLADVVLEKAQQYSNENNLSEVDFALLNSGGMRTILPPGNITVGKVFELMPFENAMVIVTLSGTQMQAFFDYMIETKKGHPLAGISLHYKKDKLVEALVQEVKFNPNKNYVVATHNYLFNGGDNMNFFKPNEGVIETQIKIRDIFIEGFSVLENLPNNTQQRLIIE